MGTVTIIPDPGNTDLPKDQSMAALSEANDAVPDDGDVAVEESSEPTLGDPEGSAEEEDEKGVSYYNRFREEKRRAKRANEKVSILQTQLSQLSSKVDEFLRQPPQAPLPQAPNPYSMPSRGQGPAATPSPQPNVDAANLSAWIEQQVETKLGARDAQATYKAAQQEALKQAVSRFPALKNESSEFYEEVDFEFSRRELEYQSLGLPVPPRLVLDVSNEIALSRKVPLGTRPSKTNGTPPPQSGKPRTPQATDVSRIPSSVLRQAEAVGISAEKLMERVNSSSSRDDILKSWKKVG